MNVLYLHSHDTGRSIQPYGAAVSTPALSTLASQGVLFRNAHSAAPTCSPSRAALLTGQYAHETGMVALAGRGGVLRNPERHLAAVLSAEGFRTALAGVSHVGPISGLGYQEFRDGDTRDSDATTEWATQFLKRQGTRLPCGQDSQTQCGQDSPTPCGQDTQFPGGTDSALRGFFLDVGYVETHRTEWVANGFSQEHNTPHDGDGDPSQIAPPAILPDVPATRRDWLDFRHSVERLDRHYATVLNALDAGGFADDTLVIATTDHGIAFPDMKCKLTSHGTGVLLIVRLPRSMRGSSTVTARVVDGLVSQIDLFPTICEVLGVRAPDRLRGRSLLPVIRGDVSAGGDAAFAEVTFHAAFEPMRSVRTQRYSYVRNFLPGAECIRPNVDDGHSKRYLVEMGALDRLRPDDELYDLLRDPLERRNVAGDQRYAGILSQMKRRLSNWMVDTADPLLSTDAGVLPLPQRVNPHTAANPGPNPIEWDPVEWAPPSRNAAALLAECRAATRARQPRPQGRRR